MSAILTVWTSTRSTIENVLKEQISFPFGVPFLLFGALSGFAYINDLESIPHLSDQGNFLYHILNFILVITIPILLMATIIPWAIKIVGKIWGGQASLRDLRIVMSFVLIPLVIKHVIGQLLFHFFSIEVLNNIIELIFYFIGLRILIIGVSVVQGFNNGKALMNIIIPYIPLFAFQLWLYLKSIPY